MTDTSSVAITHPPPALPPVTVNNKQSVPPAVDGGADAVSLAPALQQQNRQPQNRNQQQQQQQQQPDEDEPYTIKCICSFEDDDGSTVYCERCDTWQHIVCYYEKQDVPEIHNCADCEPRFLDARGATERQRRLREQQNTGGDRKSKRSSAKSSKKKSSTIKDKDKDKDAAADPSSSSSSLVVRERSASTSHLKDVPPPAKRSKTSHRFSSSLASPTGYPPQGRKRSSVSIPQIPYYSPDFLHLYDNDRANLDQESNLFLTIALTKDLMTWAQDPSTIPEDGNGRVARDSFTHLDRLHSSNWPSLTTVTKVDDSVELMGRHPTWKILTVDKDVHRDEIVGEVRGKVGYLRDYSLDPANRWQELRHPEPFVFFHPQLPIYIDSREEGTQLRYVRRSCQPNVTLKTFITNQSEYHFCFVANQDIPANSEITATWYLDPQLFGANGLLKAEGSNHIVPETAAISLSHVLSLFGGCACESASCFLAKIDRRRRLPKPESSSTTTKTAVASRRSKTKSRSTVQSEASRLSHDTIRRQQQQQQQQQEDEEDAAERRSVTGSVRFQSRSRDLTPAAGSVDANSPHDPFSGELSAREKRKLAAVEKKFEQLEQQPKRKRKDRGSTVESRQRSSSPRTAKAARPARHDVSKSRRTSSSSVKTISPKSTARSRGGKTSKASSLPPRKKYADLAIQVDLDEEEAAAAEAAAAKAFVHTDFVPPDRLRFQGLLAIYEADKKHFEELKKQQEAAEAAAAARQAAARQEELLSREAAALKSPTTPTSIRDSNISDSTDNKDASTSMSLNATDQSKTDGSAIVPPTVSRPADADASLPASSRITATCPGPGPSGIVGETPSGTAITATPGSSSSAISSLAPVLPAQTGTTGTGTVVSSVTTSQAAPVKKKLTLNDYMSRRGTLSSITTPMMEKTPAQAMESAVNSAIAAAASGSGADSKLADEEARGEKGSVASGSEDVVMGNTDEKPPIAGVSSSGQDESVTGNNASGLPTPSSNDFRTEKQASAAPAVAAPSESSSVLSKASS